VAVLYITEYRKLAIEGQGAFVPIGVEPSSTATLAIGAASAQSGALNSATKFVRVHTDAICHVSFGTNPTATTSSMRFAAGQTEFFGVVGGHKVAVIEGV
jgi:hypothetical protein